ncbi:MAG TPA: hypothetical protein VE007_12320, partial [Thermoanaerobaculia bacterium]|nr:hypothetical protein [Thermoanaerobaculia bacterium]
LYLGCLGTLYTLYLAAWVLFVAAAGMIADDAFSQNPERRRSARRFLLATPVFCIALLAAYSPWLPVVLRAARRPPPVPAAPLTLERAGRILGFFAFESSEGVQPERADLAFLALAAAGTVMAIRRPGSRFLVAWGIGGLAAVEGLYRLHPDWDAARRYLPAAIALVGLAALPVSGLMSTKTGKILAVALLAGVLLLQTAALRTYFRTGRQDWRPLGAFLKARPAEEQIFAENQWSQICTAFYVIGPEWLADGGRHGRPVSNLDGEIVRLTYSWPAGKTAWLVVEGNPQRQELRAWARQFEEIPFPTADGARVYRLDPSRRDTALAGR